MNIDEFEDTYYNWKYKFELKITDREGNELTDGIVKGDWEDLGYLARRFKNEINKRTD